MSKVFTVTNFTELMSKENAVDVYSVNPTEPIGTRGEALIGAFSGMFKGDVDAFSKKIKSLPLALIKSMLSDIVKDNLIKVRDNIQKEFETSHSDEDIKKAVLEMAASKRFLLTVELPSKLTATFVPLTVDRISKIPSHSRLEIVTSLLIKIGDDTKTKEGVREDLMNLSYEDFEYLYAYLDLVNLRLSKVNWKDLVKNL